MIMALEYVLATLAMGQGKREDYFIGPHNKYPKY